MTTAAAPLGGWMGKHGQLLWKPKMRPRNDKSVSKISEMSNNRLVFERFVDLQGARSYFGQKILPSLIISEE